jgi:16S rRNA (uracil1498-N3)-methyltransferase
VFKKPVRLGVNGVEKIMTAQRFVIESFREDSSTVLLEGDEFHHLARVLRKSPGDKVEVLNGRGCIGIGLIKTIEKDKAAIQIVSRVNHTRIQPELHLAVALPNSENVFDGILKQCTQLGVSWFHPIISSRSRHVNRSILANRMDRWRRIVVNSCKQCRQPWFPGLSEPIELEEFVSAKLNKPATILMGWEPGITEYIKIASRSISYGESIIWLVGSEGGWTDQERRHLEQSGIQSLRLGAFVLTTAVACVAGSGLLIAEQQRTVNELSSDYSE